MHAVSIFMEKVRNTNVAMTIYIGRTGEKIFIDQSWTMFRIGEATTLVPTCWNSRKHVIKSLTEQQCLYSFLLSWC